jgi:hypothetical protein
MSTENEDLLLRKLLRKYRIAFRKVARKSCLIEKSCLKEYAQKKCFRKTSRCLSSMTPPLPGLTRATT